MYLCSLKSIIEFTQACINSCRNVDYAANVSCCYRHRCQEYAG